MTAADALSMFIGFLVAGLGIGLVWSLAGRNS